MIGEPVNEQLDGCIRFHCQSGIRKGERFGTAIGCGNEDLVIEIISKSLALIRNEQRDTMTLATMVGTATLVCTSVNFSWPAACKVIEVTGNTRLLKFQLDEIISPYPLVMKGLGYGAEASLSSVRSGVRGLAKVILWTEAFTFLREYLRI